LVSTRTHDNEYDVLISALELMLIAPRKTLAQTTESTHQTIKTQAIKYPKR